MELYTSLWMHACTHAHTYTQYIYIQYIHHFQHSNRIRTVFCSRELLLLLFIYVVILYISLLYIVSLILSLFSSILHMIVHDMYLWYASKRMQPISNLCAPRFDKKRAALLWFASGFVQQARNTVLQQFLPNAPRFFQTRRNSAKCDVLSREKRQDCGTLQDSALS